MVLFSKTTGCGDVASLKPSKNCWVWQSHSACNRFEISKDENSIVSCEIPEICIMVMVEP